MGSARMELIYIDDEDHARRTDLALRLTTDTMTRKLFDSYRKLEVDRDKARFLLDYYNAEGDLDDTILLDEAGFHHVTGQPAKTNAEYCAIDEKFWRDVLTMREVAHGQG